MLTFRPPLPPRPWARLPSPCPDAGHGSRARLLRQGLASLLVGAAVAVGQGQAPVLASPPTAAPAAGAPAASSATQRRSQRWGDGLRLEILPFRQSSPEPAARSHYDLLIPPGTIPGPISALQIGFLEPLSGASPLARRLRLCRVPVPLSLRRFHCLEPWPLAAEVRDGALWIRPLRPLDPAAAYVLSAETRNPLRQGPHPLRLYGVGADPSPPLYLGTWLIEILSRAE